jgi:DNA-binding HxlR family transcriptional regulator
MNRPAGSGPRNAFDSDCPSRVVLNHVASRWGTLIVTCLRDGPQRFYMLRDRVGGISEKMLSQNLRLLAQDGLVERQVEPTSPPQVTYVLTPLGEELGEHLQALVDWVTLRTDQILEAQDRNSQA